MTWAPLSPTCLYPERSGCLAPPHTLNCKLPGKRQRRRRPCPTPCLRASAEERMNESLASLLERRQCSIIFLSMLLLKIFAFQNPRAFCISKLNHQGFALCKRAIGTESWNKKYSSSQCRGGGETDKDSNVVTRLALALWQMGRHPS